MSEIGALWAFVIANMLLFAFGSVITGLSYAAYRSSGRARSFRYSTIGFGLITLGGVIEPIYQLGLKRDYQISGRELLELQALEGILLAGGLACLFISIYGYTRKSNRVSAHIDLAPDGRNIER